MHPLAKGRATTTQRTMSQSSARDIANEKIANGLFEHDVLVSIGDQYGKTAAQVAL
jgi:diketogulonate reductase-like aldo/keto reductase